MKRIIHIAVSLLLLAFVVASCKSHHVLTDDSKLTDNTFDQREFLQKVKANGIKSVYLTSKLKFSAALGGQDVTVSGSLKMKRDDVIRIQLVPYGIMEVGRLEFTKDYVLIVDRINRQYVKAAYDDIDFLKSNGINFYSLQALFWNELFQPGKQRPVLDDFTTTQNAVQVNVRMDKNSMQYEWDTNRQDGQITATHVKHLSNGSADAQMDWKYQSFKPLGKQMFPNDMQVNVKAKGKTLNVGLELSSIKTDGGFELRTDISGKYKKVDANEIFRKLMSL